MSDTPEIPSRRHIATEAANPRTEGLDELSTADALERIQAEDAAVHEALAAARPDIVRAVELIHPRLAQGGRLIYVGAGTSGRLGLLDAVECPPTFQCAPEQVQGVLAGGRDCMFRSSEDAEDSEAFGRRDLEALDVGELDVVFGISAGGTTPYVHAALARAREAGAGTVMFACVPFEQVPDRANVSIRVLSGPEVLQGSTRMKAGTVTKLVLNSVSTLVMLRLGKVYGNRMVDVNTAGNAKLFDRGIRLVEDLCELSRDDARALLEAAGGQVKLAILMRRADLDAAAAEQRLGESAGDLRRALGESTG